jgi:hypothetical protein
VAKIKHTGPANEGDPTSEALRTKKVKAGLPKPAPTRTNKSSSAPSRPAVPEPKEAARPKSTPSRHASDTHVQASISRRLREIRQDLFGDHGGPEMARRLNLPARTWYNYETGVSVPAEVLLAFANQTGANPIWLLSGEGPKYRRGQPEASRSEPTPIELIRQGLEKLEQEPNDVVIVAPEDLPRQFTSDFGAVSLIPMEELARTVLDPSQVEGYIMAYRHWLPNPSETVGVRLTDDAMYPILPSGSVVAIDRSNTDIRALQGRMVAASPEGRPLIRWLDISGRHMVLRPNQPGREHPLIPVDLDGQTDNLIIGQVVWSWSRFSQ